MNGDRVVYERPDCAELNDEGWRCVDMHFHSSYSDSYSGVKSIIKLAQERGAGVAITDHNLVQGVEKALEEKSDVFIIPGMEISSWDGPHILVYFYEFGELKEYWNKSVRPYLSKSPWLSINRSVTQILDSLEGTNSVVSAAHPMGYYISYRGIQQGIESGKLDPSIAKRFDAYEVTGGSMSRSYNLRARKAADGFGLGYTGGTDGHLLGELAHVVTCSKATDVEGFLNDVKSNNTMIVGEEESLLTKGMLSVACLSRFVGYLPASISHRVNHAFDRFRPDS